MTSDCGTKHTLNRSAVHSTLVSTPGSQATTDHRTGRGLGSQAVGSQAQRGPGVVLLPDPLCKVRRPCSAQRHLGDKQVIPARPVHVGVEDGHSRSEEHTSELQSPCNLVCRLLLEKKKKIEN